MNNFQRLAVILCLSLILLACSGGSTDSEAEPVSVGGAYPKMGVAELDTYLAENTGKPAMLLFWTTWCPSCKQEIPELEQLNKTYGDKVNILAISLDEDVAALDAFFADKKIELPVYIGDQAIARKFEVEAIPTLALIDKNGKLIFAKPGVFPYAMLQRMADKLLGQ